MNGMIAGPGDGAGLDITARHQAISRLAFWT